MKPMNRRDATQATRNTIRAAAHAPPPPPPPHLALSSPTSPPSSTNNSTIRITQRFHQQLSPIPWICFHVMSFWSEACEFATSKSLQTRLDAAYASCGVTVRRCSCCRYLTGCIVTRGGADCGVLRERVGGRGHVLRVAADAGGGSAARVAAVRMVQRADSVRELLRRCDVGSQDDESCECIQTRQRGNVTSRSGCVLCP